MARKTSPPNSGRRGLERGLKKAARPVDLPPSESDREVDDDLDAARVADSSGAFAPKPRLDPDDGERDCPDEPPPGWGET